MGSILIVAEIQAGQIRESSFELAAYAQKIAAATGSEITSVVLALPPFSLMIATGRASTTLPSGERARLGGNRSVTNFSAGGVAADAKTRFHR